MATTEEYKRRTDAQWWLDMARGWFLGRHIRDRENFEYCFNHFLIAKEEYHRAIKEGRC